MRSRGERLRQGAGRLWRWLFPPEVQLPAEARRSLALLYPTLDLRRITFHRGLPHVLRGRAQGVTLPDSWKPLGCHVYIRWDLWRPETRGGLSLLAHEAFHALQMQESGPSLGLMRPFLVLYLACAAGNGFVYREHPMEQHAYAVAGRRRSRFDRDLAAGAESAAVTESGLLFWRLLVQSVPGGRRATGPRRLLCALLSVPWLLAWTGAAAVLWVGWLAVTGLGAMAAVTQWAAGSLLGSDKVKANRRTGGLP